jgi:hypothetical protein
VFDGTNLSATGDINAKSGTFSGDIVLSGSLKKTGKSYEDSN